VGSKGKKDRKKKGDVDLKGEKTGDSFIYTSLSKGKKRGRHQIHAFKGGIIRRAGEKTERLVASSQQEK